LFYADVKGMVDEPSNMPKGRIGDDDGCLRLAPIKEVVTLIDVIEDLIVAAHNNVVADDAVPSLFQCRNKPPVSGARLPDCRILS
jgi:hypothetical protein